MQPQSNGSPAGDAFVAAFNRIQAEQERTLEFWIEKRLRFGYAAAHPDDGWVDRERNVVQFVYPQFKLDLAPGAAVALGDQHHWRPVRLVRELPRMLPGDAVEVWEFEPFPQHPPAKHWWVRAWRAVVGYNPHTWHRLPGAYAYCEFCRDEASFIIDY